MGTAGGHRGRAGHVNAAAAERTLANEFDLRRATLWGLLIAAVAVLGTIALRLLRDPTQARKVYRRS